MRASIGIIQILYSHPFPLHLIHFLSFLSIQNLIRSIGLYFGIPANLELSINHTQGKVDNKEAMAAATATVSQATIITAAISGSGKASPMRTKVNYISGLNSFGGLKAHNSVVSLGLPVSTEQSFAKIVSSLNYPSKNKGRSGGALSSTCNAAGEIFRIASIIQGLVLIGVALGFVLLRVESSLEESE